MLWRASEIIDEFSGFNIVPDAIAVKNTVLLDKAIRSFASLVIGNLSDRLSISIFFILIKTGI
ncbi:hypothetical protein BpJC7_15930 [Weizmannia acidilactici]|uniref:Uncharacterized protein n=1 Tax=Weizmannia acidilactici TaxID=2607726 RepID=A0A5J4JID8_9BACI|nr:hypothetical protein BpJC4_23160 [Weizmannia acidilactici]GER70290.1 hypothetical protein BpJC7_15930 [Weizmannia acidilactici]GER74899.1 hypothetical protein BpPP18_29660 [Weizmannia acidilactici]